MIDATSSVPPSVRRLAAAAALVHVLPDLTVEVSVGARGAVGGGRSAGRRLLVSHRADLGPDLTPCELRRLVARLTADERAAAGFGWLREVELITVAGDGVTTGDGIVLVADRHGDGGCAAFTSDLDTPLVMTSARRWAEEMVADDPTAALALREVQLRVDRDDLLGTSVVTIPWSVATRDEAAFVAAALSARCAVDALLGAALARRH